MVSDGVFVQLGIILCGSVSSRSMVETRERTEVKAILTINEAPKDLYFETLRASTRVWNCRKGHGQAAIDTVQ